MKSLLDFVIYLDLDIWICRLLERVDNISELFQREKESIISFDIAIEYILFFGIDFEVLGEKQRDRIIFRMSMSMISLTLMTLK